jgi:hypothetical protein
VALFAGLPEGVGIGVDLGKSGLVALDGDRPDALHATFPSLLEIRGSWILQGNPERRTYLWRQDGTVGCPTAAWGEVRGVGGYIVLPPSPHPVGGQYRWIRGATANARPPAYLPEEIRAALPAKGAGSEKATGSEVMGFLERAKGTARVGLLEAVLDAYRTKVSEGHGRHGTAAECLVWAMEEAEAGAYPATEAQQALQRAFQDSLSKGQPRAYDAEEWRGLVQWAVGQVLAADPAEKAKRREALGLDLGKGDLATLGRPDVRQEDPEPMPRLPLAFWESRETLLHVRMAARSRGLGPDGVLMAVLARATTTLGWRWVLPPIVGGITSPNLFGVLAAPSGSGKSAALSLARELLPTMASLTETTMGTSGGLVDSMGSVVGGDGLGPKRWEADADPCLLVTAPEVDDWLDNLGMGVGTGAMVRSAWMGEALGGTYRGSASKAKVDSLTYRLGMLVGAQPRRLGGLLTGRERDGGTPQRMLWASTMVDEDLTVDTMPDYPGALEWSPWTMAGKQGRTGYTWDGGSSLRHMPDGSQDAWLHVKVDPAVVRQIKVDHLEQAKSLSGSDLDTHRNLSRLKAAVALAVLERPQAHGVEVTAEDWALAGVLLDTSDLVRDWMEVQVRGLQAETEAEKAAAKREAERTLRTQDERVAQAVLRALAEAGSDGMAGADLRRKITSRDRAALDGVLETLHAQGVLIHSGHRWWKA